MTDFQAREGARDVLLDVVAKAAASSAGSQFGETDAEGTPRAERAAPIVRASASASRKRPAPDAPAAEWVEYRRAKRGMEKGFGITADLPEPNDFFLQDGQGSWLARVVLDCVGDSVLTRLYDGTPQCWLGPWRPPERMKPGREASGLNRARNTRVMMMHWNCKDRHTLNPNGLQNSEGDSYFRASRFHRDRPPSRG